MREKRSEILHIRMTPTEKKKLMDVAATLECSMTDVILSAVILKAPQLHRTIEIQKIFSDSKNSL